MKIAPYMQVVVDAALFLGLRGDDVIDPDAAVAQLESMASNLRKLSAAEKRDLVDYFHEAAEREASKWPTSARRDLLLSLADDLGLT